MQKVGNIKLVLQEGSSGQVEEGNEEEVKELS